MIIGYVPDTGLLVGGIKVQLEQGRTVLPAPGVGLGGHSGVSFRFHFLMIPCSCISSAQDPDPLDPQHVSFLDPEPDPEKYADPRGKYPPKTANKNVLLSKPKYELLKEKENINYL